MTKISFSKNITTENLNSKWIGCNHFYTDLHVKAFVTVG